MCVHIYIYNMQYPSLVPIAQKQKGSTPESNTIELFDDAWGFFFTGGSLIEQLCIFFPDGSHRRFVER